MSFYVLCISAFVINVTTEQVCFPLYILYLEYSIVIIILFHIITGVCLYISNSREQWNEHLNLLNQPVDKHNNLTLRHRTIRTTTKVSHWNDQ